MEKVARQPHIVRALRFIRRMNGSTESSLMEADDGAFYVVKSPSNPLGPRVLVNELLACSIANFLGLPTPPPTIVAVPPHLDAAIRPTSQAPNGSSGPLASFGYGSKLPENATAIFDQLPRTRLHQICNLITALEIFLFDVWSGNSESRHSVFARCAHQRGKSPCYWMTMIDNDGCFGGTEHGFAETAREMTTLEREAFTQGGSSSSLRLGRRISSLTLDQLVGFARSVPAQWLSSGQERDEIFHICEILASRRTMVASLINGAELDSFLTENRLNEYQSLPA